MKLNDYLLDESKKTPVGKKFKMKAKRLVPEQSDLFTLIDDDMDADTIDEILFRESEYLGGIATVILRLIK